MTATTSHSPVFDTSEFGLAWNQHEDLISRYPRLAWAREPFRTHDWYLIEVTRDVRTKLGLAFRKGDRTVAYDRPAEYAQNGELAMPAATFAWSFRNHIETSLPPRLFRRLAS